MAIFKSLGLGLGLENKSLGLGLGLETKSLGLGLGLETKSLGLGLGLEVSGLDNKTAGNPPDRFRIPSITGFAHVPQGPRGIRGQIATLSDPDLGDRLRRTFQESRTYQLYVAQGEAARGLSIGFPCSASMESVAIDVVDQNRHYDIADIKLNFADALLVERFRQISSLAAFEGYCMTPPGPDQGHAIEGRFQNLAMN